MMLQDIKQFIIGNLIAGVAIQLFNSLPWASIMLFILKQFSINNYIITDQNTVKRIQKRLSSKTNTIYDEQAYGCVWDYNILANISKNQWEDISVSLYCSKETYETLTSETVSEHKSEEIVEAPKQKITIYDRSGTYADTYYHKRNVNVHSIDCRLNQCIIISNIVKQYSKKTHAVSLIYGPPNTGKSTIGILLAKQINGSYCNSFKPWLPNCTLSQLYTIVEPSEENPLIIAIDEFDVPLFNIHNGFIKPNEKMSTSMIDKCGWNTFFDDIQRGMYPYLIVLLTTNKSPEFMNELDTCYIRNGRVDVIHELV
jgi:hypothetical protein